MLETTVAVVFITIDILDCLGCDLMLGPETTLAVSVIITTVACLFSGLLVLDRDTIHLL